MPCILFGRVISIFLVVFFLSFFRMENKIGFVYVIYLKSNNDI